LPAAIWSFTCAWIFFAIFFYSFAGPNFSTGSRGPTPARCSRLPPLAHHRAWPARGSRF